MADTLDVLSLAEAKIAINMAESNTVHDTALARHITAISRLMDRECGPVVQRTVSAEVHDATDDVVTLDRSPVVSIGTVREAFPGDITTLSAGTFGGTVDAYEAERDWRGGTLLSGVLYRQWGGLRGGWPRGARVEVTYTAGRFADTASVDASFKDCAGAILRRLWKREAGTWAQSSAWFDSLEGDEGATAGSGFYRVAKPLIDEMLWADKRMVGHG